MTVGPLDLAVERQNVVAGPTDVLDFDGDVTVTGAGFVRAGVPVVGEFEDGLGIFAVVSGENTDEVPFGIILVPKAGAYPAPSCRPRSLAPDHRL